MSVCSLITRVKTTCLDGNSLSTERRLQIHANSRADTRHSRFYWLKDSSMLGCRMSRHEDILDPELPSIFAELSTFIAFGTTLVPLSQIGRRSYVDLSVRAAVRPAFMWGALDCRHVRTPVCLTSAGTFGCWKYCNVRGIRR